MVISGGVNIYPREIEDHLHTHPAILEAAVIGVPDPEWGETLRAFVVLRDGQQITETDVIDYCREGARGLQAPAQGDVPGGAAAQSDRQDPQARAPRAVAGLPNASFSGCVPSEVRDFEGADLGGPP